MTTEQIKAVLNTGFGKKYENFTPITTAQAQAVADLIKSMEPKKK
jgi:hypothetical protein